MITETLADTVMDSVQSDEELAAKPHRLLDDCLPLIEKLMKCRQRVKESYKQVYCDQTGGSADTTANTDQSQGPRGWSQWTRDALAVHALRERGPAIAPSVVVQTSEEKNLKKQMRKLEKKPNKELYREGEEQVSAGGAVTIEDIERTIERQCDQQGGRGLDVSLPCRRPLLSEELDIKRVGLYNFKPSVRPVPIEVHVAGFHGEDYCPRMALMNKPAYRAILEHSPDKPVLIFVSSRFQARHTANDLKEYVVSDGDNNLFLHMDGQAMTALQNVKDSSLKKTLGFGIGLHHAGLKAEDRALVEELFSNEKIQVLVITEWQITCVSLLAHMVIIKGTEYSVKINEHKVEYFEYDSKDVLQMLGRAGRPQYDTTGVAVVLVKDTMKEFYKKFLYEPFAVESVANDMNAEMVSDTVCLSVQ